MPIHCLDVDMSSNCIGRGKQKNMQLFLNHIETNSLCKICKYIIDGFALLIQLGLPYLLVIGFSFFFVVFVIDQLVIHLLQRGHGSEHVRVMLSRPLFIPSHGTFQNSFIFYKISSTKLFRKFHKLNLLKIMSTKYFKSFTNSTFQKILFI